MPAKVQTSVHMNVCGGNDENEMNDGNDFDAVMQSACGIETIRKFTLT